jgi:hypothetical protein
MEEELKIIAMSKTGLLTITAFEKVIDKQDLQLKPINEEDYNFELIKIIKSANLKRVPDSYIQKIVNKEPFSVEIVTTEVVTYSGK